MLVLVCNKSNQPWTRHVINLVIDNWAQWFVVVPGAINLVQGPANYEALLRMGVPPDQVGGGRVGGGGSWVRKYFRSHPDSTRLLNGTVPLCFARVVFLSIYHMMCVFVFVFIP